MITIVNTIQNLVCIQTLYRTKKRMQNNHGTACVTCLVRFVCVQCGILQTYHLYSSFKYTQGNWTQIRHTFRIFYIWNQTYEDNNICANNIFQKVRKKPGFKPYIPSNLSVCMAKTAAFTSSGVISETNLALSSSVTCLTNSCRVKPPSSDVLWNIFQFVTA